MIQKITCILILFMGLLYAETKVVGYSYMTSPSTDEYDYSRYTHVIGSFVFSDKEGNLWFSEWNPADSIVAALKKAEQQGAVPMIALGTTTGGWDMTQDKAARTNFITNLLAWCDEHNIKGIDLDLEGNAAEFNWGNPPTFFPEAYQALAVELRAAMPDSMLLTSAVGSFSRNGAQWTDTFIAQLDWINVMVYDRALSWESSPVENHSTYDGHLSAASYWHDDRGLAKDRIVLGVPFYARGWDRDNNRMYREDPGWDVTTWDYKDFILRYDAENDQDTIDFPAEDSIRYARAEGVTGKGTLFFNSPAMIKRKCEWAMKNAYGGLMIWHLGADLPTNHEQSLIKVIDSIVDPAEHISDSYVMSSNTSSVTVEASTKELYLSGMDRDKAYAVNLYGLNGQRVLAMKIADSVESTTFSLEAFKARGVFVYTLLENGKTLFTGKLYR